MKNKAEEKSAEITSWFSLKGPYDDVILSTRVRLVRNLADFQFPGKMNAEDRNRVTSLVYDAVCGADDVHFVKYEDLSEPGKEILGDKNFLKEGQKCDAVVLNSREDVFAIINDVDHLSISTFTAGLDPEAAMQKVYAIDEELQTKLQFAASFEFGYLTSRIKDCGTGMKISVRCFTPSIVLSGKLDSVMALIQEKRFCVRPVFKAKEIANFSNCIFDIYAGTSADGSELDQMAAIHSIATNILKTERKIRREFADNNPTIVLNFVKQSYAKAIYTILMTYEDCVDIICAVKWGLQTGLIKGISESELNSLFYRTKTGHLRYLCDNFSFSFEEDIKSDINLKIKRLRAIVIQQAFENIQFKG